MRSDDLLARLGGDEFVVICREITYTGEAETIAERLLLALAHPFFVRSEELAVSASVGIALSDNTAKGRKESAETLLHDADAAMYRAKSQGPGRYTIFDRSMKADRVNRDKVEQRLRDAFDDEEFELHYQPIINVDDERIVGVEALLRWQHPQRGTIPPLDFVPQLEETGDPFLIADPSRESVLLEAGIDRAKGLVCAVDSDAVNVYMTLTARALNLGTEVRTVNVKALPASAVAAVAVVKAVAWLTVNVKVWRTVPRALVALFRLVST